MKKCPFCKADIEDNARFCLYCMKSLGEKEVIPPPQRKTQWRPFALMAAVLVALVAVMMLLPREKGHLPAVSTGEERSSTGQSTEGSADSTESDDALQIDATTEASDLNQKPTQNQNPTTQKPTENPTSGTKPTTPTIPSTTPTGSTTAPAETTQPANTPEETTAPEETKTPETQKTEVVYTYRAARAGDDFNTNYQNNGNDIVITGISQPSADGAYDIPAYIEGKKVIAIVANAFSDSNAKVVYIPDTIKTIWNYAFAGCNLTDIYFRGDAIYTESKAFSGSITIHCSASCSDRNFRYYKNCAANYGATWVEWNG